MFIRTASGIVLLAMVFGGVHAARDVPMQQRIPLRLGETEIELVVHDSGRPGPAFISVHDNEDTGVEAALRVIGENGGSVLELSHRGERNITFTLEGRPYTFDPNRIYTEAGIRRTLALHGSCAPEAERAVAAFADVLLHHFLSRSGSVVVTIHNNDPDLYSLRSYQRGGEEYGNARRVHEEERADPDDFFFVTDSALYERLSRRGYNVVLQDSATVEDDGSLSVYCGRKGIRYVNVEAQHGHRDEQERMLRTLADLLAESSGF